MNRTTCLLSVLFGICAGMSAAADPDIVIQESGPDAESMTTTADGAVIFGSMSKAEIFRATKGATSAEVRIKPGSNGLQRTLGVFADQKDGSLWACSSGTPTALKTFDLANGAPKASYDFPGGTGTCNTAPSMPPTPRATESFVCRRVARRSKPGVPIRSSQAALMALRWVMTARYTSIPSSAGIWCGLLLAQTGRPPQPRN